MSLQARVFAAVPQPAFSFLERALGGRFALTACHAYDDALGRLRRAEDIDVVVCGVYFDQSRMFDLLQYVGGRLPFVCCRILPLEMPAISLEALRIACENLGAAFVDLPGLRQRYGIDADAELRARVLGAMRPGLARGG